MLLSIDSGSSCIHVCEGSYKSGCVEIVKTAESRLPVSTIIDGLVKNQPSMVMTINKLLQSANFKSSYSVFTFNSSRVLSRKIELPASKPKELAMMVKNEMMQVVSDAGDVAVEYSVDGEPSGKDKTVSLWAYAMPKENVDEYYSIFKNIKLKPAALDIHPNCVEKLFSGSLINGGEINQKSVLFGDIGASSVEIHLFCGGKRAFSRISPLSSSEFEVILNNMGYKKSGSVFETIDVSPSKLKSDGVLSDIAGKYFSKLADEFQKMMQFQLRRDSLNPVTRIFLYGGMSFISGISEYLSSFLGADVQVIKTVSKIKCADTVKIAKFINCAGALIRL